MERGRGFVGEEPDSVEALGVDSLFEGAECGENIGGGRGRDDRHRLAKLPPNRANLDNGSRCGPQRSYFPACNCRTRASNSVTRASAT